MSSSNLPSFVLDNCLKIDRIIYSELQMNRWFQNCSENFRETCDDVSYSSSIFAYFFPIRDNRVLRKKNTFAWNKQFKYGSFAFGAHKLGKDVSHAF